MTRPQIFLIAGAFACLLFLYFGFDTKTKDLAQIEKQRALNAASTDIKVLLKEAKTTLAPGQSATILSLEQAIAEAASDEEKVQNLKLLSGSWFEMGKAEIAGFYAAQIAEILQDEEAWSIAGTTYAIALQRASSEKVKDFCAQHAIAAFEKAITLNPQNIDHKVNLAVCYTDYPPKDNPMKGILMLIDLNKKHPDNISVLTNLGRLGIQTGQYEKAVKRLEKVIALQADHPKAYCLLAEAFAGLKRNTEAQEAANKCRQLSGSN